MHFFRLFSSLFSSFRQGRTRNYRGILSLTYRLTTEDRADKQLHKSARLKKKMLELLATQKKAQIRERIQFLSDNFLTTSHHGKSE